MKVNEFRYSINQAVTLAAILLLFASVTTLALMLFLLSILLHFHLTLQVC